MTFHENFQPQNCLLNSSTPQRAATLGAGVQVYEMYEEMDKYDAAMVGGANPVSRNLSSRKTRLINIFPDCWRCRLVHRRWTWPAFE